MWFWEEVCDCQCTILSVSPSYNWTDTLTVDTSHFQHVGCVHLHCFYQAAFVASLNSSSDMFHQSDIFKEEHKFGLIFCIHEKFYSIFFSVFAFGRSYTVLFLARALQGIGSSCSSVSGHLKIIVIIVIIFNIATTIITLFIVTMTRDGHVGREIPRRQGARECNGTCPWRPRSWCRYRYCHHHHHHLLIIIIYPDHHFQHLKQHHPHQCANQRIIIIIPGPPFGGFMYQFVGKTGALKQSASSSCSSSPCTSSASPSRSSL